MHFNYFAVQILQSYYQEEPFTDKTFVNRGSIYILTSNCLHFLKSCHYGPLCIDSSHRVHASTADKGWGQGTSPSSFSETTQIFTQQIVVFLIKLIYFLLLWDPVYIYTKILKIIDFKGLSPMAPSKKNQTILYFSKKLGTLIQKNLDLPM